MGRRKKTAEEKRRHLPCRVSPEAEKIYAQAARRRSIALGDFMDNLALGLAAMDASDPLLERLKDGLGI